MHRLRKSVISFFSLNNASGNPTLQSLLQFLNDIISLSLKNHMLHYYTMQEEPLQTFQLSRLSVI